MSIFTLIVRIFWELGVSTTDLAVKEVVFCWMLIWYSLSSPLLSPTMAGGPRCLGPRCPAIARDERALKHHWPGTTKHSVFYHNVHCFTSLPNVHRTFLYMYRFTAYWFIPNTACQILSIYPRLNMTACVGFAVKDDSRCRVRCQMWQQVSGSAVRPMSKQLIFAGPLWARERTETW